ncbi:flagellin [Paenibacillus sp.]|uniref:flagellin n=1 Tax=Paenibacillus sp. TaxID=58172 RepID=UPI002D4FA30B|nr:flagellin [Paenibacillus sp.]HZG56715.1 flagellin [Paenibacillus sp.]
MTISFASILESISNYQRLQKTNDKLMTQLTTGKRINSPSDDPQLFRRISAYETESASYEMYLDNIDGGLAAASHVQDAVGQQLEMIEEMRKLAERVTAGGLSNGERAALNEQYEELTEELNAIAENAGIGGAKYLDGTYADEGLRIATGPNGEFYELTLPNTTAGDDGLDLEDTSISSVGNANAALTSLDAAAETLSGLQQRLGTSEFILESRSNLMESKQTELDKLVAKYQEVDPMKLAAQLDRNKTLQQYALAAVGSAFAMQQSLVDYLFPR